MEVSIIIVNYNTLKITSQCIDSIKKYSENVSYEIILVDNASSDGSIDFFEEQKDILFIQSNENIGFGRANNLGSKYAKGKYLFFLNSDTIFLNNVLDFFVDSYRNLEDNKEMPGVLGALLLNTDLKVNSSYGRFENTYQEIFSLIKHSFRMIDLEKRFNKQSGDFSVDWIVGADMFMKKEIFDQVSGFDEKFFMYSEEVDLQKRIIDKGFTNHIISGPRIIHLEGASSEKKISNRKRLMVDNSRFIYHKKHSTTFDYLLYRILYFFLRSPSIANPNYSFKENRQYLGNLVKRKV